MELRHARAARLRLGWQSRACCGRPASAAAVTQSLPRRCHHQEQAGCSLNCQRFICSAQLDANAGQRCSVFRRHRRAPAPSQRRAALPLGVRRRKLASRAARCGAARALPACGSCAPRDRACSMACCQVVATRLEQRQARLTQGLAVALSGGGGARPTFPPRRALQRRRLAAAGRALQQHARGGRPSCVRRRAAGERGASSRPSRAPCPLSGPTCVADGLSPRRLARLRCIGCSCAWRRAPRRRLTARRSCQALCNAAAQPRGALNAS